MAKGIRRNHGPAFKAKVALAALKGDKTLPELSDQFDVHSNQISAWKKELEQNASELFDRGKRNDETGMVKDMQAKIGQLTMENDFLAGALGRVASSSAKK